MRLADEQHHYPCDKTTLEPNMSAYITATGSFLPGDPVSNDEIENYIGKAGRWLKPASFGEPDPL
jgi:hypothetical protein